MSPLHMAVYISWSTARGGTLQLSAVTVLSANALRQLRPQRAEALQRPAELSLSSSRAAEHEAKTHKLAIHFHTPLPLSDALAGQRADSERAVHSA